MRNQTEAFIITSSLTGGTIIISQQSFLNNREQSKTWLSDWILEYYEIPSFQATFHFYLQSFVPVQLTIALKCPPSLFLAQRRKHSARQVNPGALAGLRSEARRRESKIKELKQIPIWPQLPGHMQHWTLVVCFLYGFCFICFFVSFFPLGSEQFSLHVIWFPSPPVVIYEHLLYSLNAVNNYEHNGSLHLPLYMRHHISMNIDAFT